MTTTAAIAACEDFEIPVWYRGREKWVTGLTRRTTCDDVIYALLSSSYGESEAARQLTSYAIFERWRQVERSLMGRAKLLKIWRAWGADAGCDVRFYLRRLSAPSPSVSDASSRRHRHHDTSARRETRRKRRKQADAIASGDMTEQWILGYGYAEQEEQLNNMQRSGCTKRSPNEQCCVENIFENQCQQQQQQQQQQQHQEQQQQQPSTVTDSPMNREQHTAEFDNLLRLISSQQETIERQQWRIRQIDIQIDNYESKTHKARQLKHGADYVLDAYLPSSCGGGGGGGKDVTNRTTDIRPRVNLDVDVETSVRDYMNTLDERLSEQHAHISNLSQQIEQIAALSPISSQAPEPMSAANDVQAELLQLHEQTDACASIAMRQQCHLELIDRSIRDCDIQLSQRRDAVAALLCELENSDDGSDDISLYSPPPVIETDDSRDLLDVVSMGNERADSGNGSLSPDTVRIAYDDEVTSMTTTLDEVVPSDMYKGYVPYQTYTVYDKNQSTTISDKKIGITWDDDNSDTGLSSLNNDELTQILETLV